MFKKTFGLPDECTMSAAAAILLKILFSLSQRISSVEYNVSWKTCPHLYTSA